MTNREIIVKMTEIIKKEDINLAKQNLLMELRQHISHPIIDSMLDSLHSEFAKLSAEFNKIDGKDNGTNN